MQVVSVGALLVTLTASAAVADEVRGTQVAERTTKVASAITWAPSLDAALEQAKKEKKLVFWLQLVGELEGGL
jgi:sensor histidine kinase regulating citrate/malate metabolism